MKLKQTTLALAVAAALPAAAHAAPKITFVQPASGAQLSGEIRQDSRCEVRGTDIRRVVFYLDSTQLNTETNAPWNCDVDTRQFGDGQKRLRAIAYDSRGRSGSAEVMVNISNTQGGGGTPPAGSAYLGLPYGGTPLAVPLVFPAANFDSGGQNIAYRDLTGNNSGGAFRSGEAVDIVASNDALTPYAVNSFQTGEWMAYTINVPASGKYDIAVRASTNYGAPSAFRVEIDGVDVTGSVSVPSTGAWSTYQWVGKPGIDLTAGVHVLKLIADAQYFNVQALSVLASAPTTPSGYAGTPYSGTPVALPKAFAAADFDRGGQGVAYRDMTSGNTGGQYRTSEDVEIFANADALSQYAVNGFQSGEWMAYTVSVPASGKYDLSVNAATNYTTPSRFRIEVDGVDVTGPVSVPTTGGWNNFTWVGKPGIELAAGKRVLKVVSDSEYFNLNGLSVLAAAPTAPPPPSNVQFFCSFESSATDCGFFEQAKVPGRATLVNVSRDGSKAVRLHTQPGDSSVNGSGSWERNDLSLGQVRTDCYEGKEHWWAHSVLFPSDYVVPTSGGVVMDFHHTGSSGQANFHVDAMSFGLRLRGFGGTVLNGGRYEVTLGPVVRNQWYDFVYHVKWSSGADGFMHAWVNGQKKLTHFGPTLYSGMGCYLKLANYHDPFGLPSSVIHDRVIRGATWQDVAITPLEGVQ